MIKVVSRLVTALGLVAAGFLVGIAPAWSLTTPSITSTASGNTTVGLQIFDNVNLSGGAGPTGNLSFSVFGPDNATCSGTAAFTSTIPAAGNGSYNSAHFTTSQAGTYRWEASYSGDANNNPVGPTSCSDPSESVIVSKFPAGLTTTASPTVAVGGTVHDTAMLGGLGPSGTINFSLNLSSQADPFCSGSPVFTATVAVSSGSGNYVSPNFTPTVAGTYRWRASYSGDANNAPVPITACLDPNESVVVTPAMATPAISTVASGPVSVGGMVADTATISGGNNPTGVVSFALFGPNDTSCGNPPAFTSMTSAAGNGSYASGMFTVATAGTYRWTASYSGDGNNVAAASACGAANESVVVTKASPTIVTQASAPVVVGATIGDTATLSGGFSPTGTISFNLFGPDNAGCTGTPAFTSTRAVSGNGNVSSALFAPSAAGTYRWVATYSGDANDNPSGPTACTDPAEAVVVSSSSTTTTTTVPPTTTTTTTVPPTTTTTSTTTTTTVAPTTTTTSTTTTSTTTSSTTTTVAPTTTTTSTTTTVAPTTTTTSTTSTTVPATTTTTSSTTTSSTTTTVPSTTTTSTATTVAPTSTTSTTTTTVAPTTTTSTSTTTPTTSTTTTTPLPPPTTTTSTSTTTTTSTSTTTTTSLPPPTTTTSSSTTTSTTTGQAVQASPSTVTAGQPLLVKGSGFPSGSQLLINLFSTPVLLGITTADSSGNYQATVTIPASTTPGAHTIVVAPATGTPQARTAILVTAPAVAATSSTTFESLSFTGADIGAPALLAAALVLAGIMMLAVTWRRRPHLRSPR